MQVWLKSLLFCPHVSCRWEMASSENNNFGTEDAKRVKITIKANFCAEIADSNIHTTVTVSVIVFSQVAATVTQK